MTMNGNAMTDNAATSDAVTSDATWLDPRPLAQGHALAPRPAPGAKRRIELFDNSKMSPPYHHWRPFRDGLQALLERMGEVRIVYSDLLMEPASAHASRIAPRGWPRF